jgi:antitoxin component of RelBE/YafQ-DinJ toxin-antitoxin module
MQNGKKRKDKVIIVRLDAEQKDQAERIATENGATVSELIRSLLSKKKAVKMI